MDETINEIVNGIKLALLIAIFAILFKIASTLTIIREDIRYNSCRDHMDYNTYNLCLALY